MKTKSVTQNNGRPSDSQNDGKATTSNCKTCSPIFIGLGIIFIFALSSSWTFQRVKFLENGSLCQKELARDEGDECVSQKMPWEDRKLKIHQQIRQKTWTRKSESKQGMLPSKK